MQARVRDDRRGGPGGDGPPEEAARRLGRQEEGEALAGPRAGSDLHGRDRSSRRPDPPSDTERSPDDPLDRGPSARAHRRAANEDIRRRTHEDIARIAAAGPRRSTAAWRNSTGSGTSSGRWRPTPPPSPWSAWAWGRSWTAGSTCCPPPWPVSCSSTPSRAGARRCRCSAAWASARPPRSRRAVRPEGPPWRLPGRPRRGRPRPGGRGQGTPGGPAPRGGG